MYEIFKSKRLIDGKVKCVIVDKNGDVVNKTPSKKDLEGIEEEQYKRYDKNKYYTDKELLDGLIRFVEKYGRIPVETDLMNNPLYPSYMTYRRRFGSWNKALKLVGMDLDIRSMEKCLKTSVEKARHAEIKVINHFRQNATDLTEENCNSPYDGICPNGQTYDVKSSKLYSGGFWQYCTNNKYKEEIDIYYFLAFNEDYTKLRYGWRVPGGMVGKYYFRIGLSPNYEFNVGNMEKYDITERLNISTDECNITSEVTSRTQIIL
jgi:hypothetical protein